MNLWSPGGVAESPQGDDLYASPAGRSFCAYASSRALLHVGSLSLWDRQPSNAPPLLLSPAGLATRRGPPYQNALGAVPQDPLTLKLRRDMNDAKASSVRRRRYALKVPAAHFMLGNCKPIAGSHDVEPMGWISSCLPRRPLPRCGGGERGGGKYAVATFGAHLCAVRIWIFRPRKIQIRIQHS